MICRLWTGKVRNEKAGEYLKFLKERAEPDYLSTIGNQGVQILKRVTDASTTEFLIITYWDDIKSIMRFAGEDFDYAKYYPEDNEFLITKNKYVTHYGLCSDTTASEVKSS